MHFMALLTLLLSTAAWSFAQAPQPAFRQYTASHGLPSSETHDLFQDHNGYIWIATDRGLSRFNGYEFRNYGPLDGLTDPAVMIFRASPQGALWMQTVSGRLFYLEGDQIRAFAGNAQLDSLPQRVTGLKGSCFDSAGNVYSSLEPNGLYRFSPKGEASLIETPNHFPSAYQVEDHILPVFRRNYSDTAALSRSNQGLCDSLHLFAGERTYAWPFHNPLKGITGFRTAYLAPDKLLAFIFGNLMLFEHGEPKWTIELPADMISFVPVPQGGFMMGLSGMGARHYQKLEDIPAGKYQSWLPDYSVTHFMEDRDGGWWFSTLEQGVFYYPSPAVLVYDKKSGLPSNYITGLSFQDDDRWLLSFFNGELTRLDTRSGKTEGTPSHSDYVSDIYYDPEKDAFWIAGNNTACLVGGKYIRFIPQGFPRSRSLARNFRPMPEQRKIWGFYQGSFFEADLDEIAVTWSTHSIQYGVRTLDVLSATDGRTWVGNIYGLYELKEKKQLIAQDAHPAFRSRIQALAELPDATLVAGTLGYGLVFWKGGQIAQLTQAEGLTSNMIEKLHVDDSGQLWAGTANGLNRIRWSWDTPPDLLALTTADGLPDNQITLVTTRGGRVFVGTTKGLAVFEQVGAKTFSPAPLLEGFWVNDSLAAAGSGTLSLRHRENNLRIKYASLQYSDPERIAYRYRLGANQEWNHTRERQLQFSTLAPGDYLFEVQARNPDGYWSESTLLGFRIRPPWWKTAWAVGGGALAILGLITGGFLYRTRQLKNRLAIQRQITELERSALRAQMNPHFIFNCLNSIQNFIVQNDAQQAIFYLGRFANLIRGVLNASTRSKAPLEEEVRLLEGYLSLEKLRFKDKFDYAITISEDIDPYETELPPLIVQPFVENAVLHGVSKLELGGKVEVHFRKKGAGVEVSVSDNGPGWEKRNKLTVEGRSSLGMEITRKRLNFSGAANEPLRVESLQAEDGSPAGTRVTIFIEAG
jgi:ligand-binding sensor domain-containing protein